jgi:hypothetical protein
VTEFRQRALALGFGVISLGLFVLLIVIYTPVARQLLWAAALATLLYPLHRRVLGLTRGHANLAAILDHRHLAIFACRSASSSRASSRGPDSWPAVGRH